MVALKRRAHTAGFGLIEVLIAAALTAGIGLTLSKIVVSGNKGQGAVAAAGDINNLKNLIYLAFSVPAACINNFQISTNPNANPNTFNWPGTPQTIQLTKGLYYPAPTNTLLIGPGPTSPQTVPIGTFGNGLSVSAMYLVITKELNTTNFAGTIHIEATKASGAAIASTTVSGATTFSADIPVLLGVSGTGPYTITSCSTSQGLPTCVQPTWNYAGSGSSTFCISNPQTPPTSVSGAMAACASLGAHLCFPEEWIIACNTITTPAFDQSGSQWADMNTGCGDPACFETMGTAGCAMGPGDAFTNSHPYRCCHN